MSPPTNSAGVRSRAAFEKNYSNGDDTAIARPAQSTIDHGKPFAMFLYNGGAAAFGETEAKFAQHPEWRPA